MTDDHSREYHDGRRLRNSRDATSLRPRVASRPSRGFILDVFNACDGVDVVIVVGLHGPASPTLPRRRFGVRGRVLAGENGRHGRGHQDASLHAHLEVGRLEVQGTHDGAGVAQESRPLLEVVAGDRFHPGVSTAVVRWHFVERDRVGAVAFRRRTAGNAATFRHVFERNVGRQALQLTGFFSRRLLSGLSVAVAVHGWHHSLMACSLSASESGVRHNHLGGNRPASLKNYHLLGNISS